MFHRERYLHFWTIGMILALGVGAHLVRGQSDSARLTPEESRKDAHFGSEPGARSSYQLYRLPSELEGRARIVRVPAPPAADPDAEAMGVLAEWEAPIHPTDMVVEVINDEAVARGVTSGSTGVEAFVFSQPLDSGYGWYLNSTPGVMQSHGMILGNAWKPNDALSSFVSRVFVPADSLGQGATRAGFRVELWDGDPLGNFDAVCSVGGTPAPIAGTTCTFTDLEGGVVYDLKCVFPSEIPWNCDRVFSVVFPLEDACRWSWRISKGHFTGLSSAPQVGKAAGMEAAWGCESYGECDTPSGYNAGTCCETGEACDHTDANPNNWIPAGGGCTFDGIPDPTLCQDAAADDYFAYPPAEPVYYHSFVGSAFSHADVVMQVIPMSVDAPPPNVPSDVTISGNSVTIDQSYPGAERHLWFEIYVSDWDPDMTGTTVKAWEAGLDVSGYTAGLECSLAPWRPACTTDADCDALQGPTGGPTDALKGGCNLPGLPPNVCAAAFAPSSHTNGAAVNDFIFYLQGFLGGIDQSKLEYRYGATLMGLPIPSPHIGDMYLGSLTLKTMCDCPAGDFSVGLGPPKTSNMVQGDNQFIPLLGVVGADIHFPTGQCCNISVDPKECVGDGVTRCECQRIGRAGHFAVSFNPGGTCEDDCSSCVTDEDCNNNNLCTLDTCRDSVCNHRALSNLPCNDGDLCTRNDWCNAGVCEGNPVDCPPDELCDPGDGVCKECYDDEHCDDGDPCTDDVCGDAGCTNELNYDDSMYCCHSTDGALCARPAVPTGDFDSDGDTDLFDFAMFQACFGSDPVTGSCDGVDLDCDCALNEHDTDDFVSALTGP